MDPKPELNSGDIISVKFAGDAAIGIVFHNLTDKTDKEEDDLSILWLTPTLEDREERKQCILYKGGLGVLNNVPYKIIGNLNGADLEETILSSL